MEICVINQSGSRTTVCPIIVKALKALAAHYAQAYALNSRTAVNLMLCDDAFIRQLNKQYRGVDRETDVLAFPMREGEDANLAPDELGDIVISMDRARRQAAEVGWGIRREVLLLTIHGFLHLLGFDDETEDAAHTMRAAQKSWLARIDQAITLC